MESGDCAVGHCPRHAPRHIQDTALWTLQTDYNRKYQTIQWKVKEFSSCLNIRNKLQVNKSLQTVGSLVEYSFSDVYDSR